jgi:hypothetical protein
VFVKRPTPTLPVREGEWMRDERDDGTEEEELTKIKNKNKLNKQNAKQRNCYCDRRVADAGKYLLLVVLSSYKLL